jgi:hypothetical protein
VLQHLTSKITSRGLLVVIVAGARMDFGRSAGVEPTAQPTRNQLGLQQRQRLRSEGVSVRACVE